MRSIATAFCLALLAGCSRGQDAYVIGAAGPWKEGYGVMTRRGIDLAVEEINSGGGIKGAPLKVLARDDEASGGRAATIAQEFVSDPSVLAVVGHVNSGAMLAASRIYDGQLAAVATTASSPDLTGVSDWTFRVISSDSLNGVILARFDFEIVGECATGAEAVREIRASPPDLVLLDVQMPELDGFDVISEIGPHNMPPVIFATAFDDYAIDAFEVGAVDYLLKPVDEERFNRTLDRAAKRLRESTDGATAGQLTSLLRKITSLSSTSGRFAVKVHGKILFLDPAEIYWIQARDDVARVHLADSAYDVREPLSHLEARLPASSFLRVHRSVIVNTSHIRAAQPFDQGDQLLILRNGKRITTGRSYRKVVQEFLRGAT
jgi:two-component system LytT family response regulator